MRRAVLLLALAAPACEREPLEVSEASEAAAGPGRGAAPPTRKTPFEPSRVEHASGLVVETRTPGHGRAARVGDRLHVHYEVRARDGEEVLDSSLTSGVPYVFVLGEGEVIAGWERGLRGVQAQNELTLEVPAALAYGSEGSGNVPGDTDLVFDIRVVKVE